MTFPQIGFFARNKKMGTVGTLKFDDVANSDTLFAFDSGRRVSLETGTRSVLVLGGTGSGKTTSVVLPMIDNMIRNGLSGLVLDVKGNLRQQVRAIAKKHNRIDDIVEFGTHPIANKTNFLCGLNNYEVSELMESFASVGVDNDHNKQFLLHGAHIYNDVWRCLNDLSKEYPNCHFSQQFTPSLLKIFAVVNNHSLAYGLWAFYRKSISNALEQCKKSGKEIPQHIIDAQTFINTVRSDNFHVLRDPRLENDINYYNQLSYALNHINGRFKSLEITHDILNKFSSQDPDSVQLDFDKLIYKDRKIVLVHFSFDSGVAGNIISKSIKSRFYQAVLRNGLNFDKKTFLIGDEFQHIVDVSSQSRMSDPGFFSLSREFKNINIIATQSIPSLRAKGTFNEIDSLISNCMTKIILQCSDIDTNIWLRNLFSKYDFQLKELKKGSCIIQTLNSDGSIVDCKDDVNNAYKTTRNIINDNIDDNLKAENGKPIPYELGPGKFPYVISNILMSEAPQFDKKRHHNMDFDDYENNIYSKLNELRKLSISNAKYWEKSTLEKYRENNSLITITCN